MSCGLGIIPPLFTLSTLHTMLTRRYRYCELQMTDRNKIPAFSKLPWLLVRTPGFNELGGGEE